MVTVPSYCALDSDCYFPVCCGWSLLFPGVLWMVTVISWCALDGHCYFLVRSRWSLLFPGALLMVIVISPVPLYQPVNHMEQAKDGLAHR